MIIVENCIVTDNVLEAQFACDITKCKGICCVEGDAGAPLLEEEIGILEELVEYVKPFLPEENVSVIEEMGVFDYDQDGNFVTTLVRNADCVFLTYENDIAVCAIEKAWEKGIVDFQKPISCHLYPIRLTENGQFTTLFYHKWHVCNDAVCRGEKEKISLIDFLETPLTRHFGKDWYEGLKSQIKEQKKR